MIGLGQRLQPVRSALEFIVSPIQKVSAGFFGSFSKPSENKRIRQLEEENAALKKQLVNQVQLQKEQQALKDQFQTTNPPAQNLLPAHVVGAPSFIPGITSIETFIIDKGTKDGVKLGQAVVYTDNIVGKITKASDHISLITLVSNKSFSFPAKTAKTEALGVLKGKGNGEMTLENVVLSDKLTVGDSVVPSFNKDEKGVGFSPNGVVGKIVSIDKKTSNLFQTALVKSMIDFSKLSMVFVEIQ